MKIVFDSLVFALHKFGGVTTYWNEFIKRFRNDSFNIAILTVPAGKYINKEFADLDKSKIQLIPEKSLPLQLLRNISPKVAAVQEKFIFHSNYLRVSSSSNAINIVTVHDFTHQFFVKGPKQLLNYYQKKKAITKSDGIVCISQNTLKDLYHFFPEAKQKAVAVIYNGCSEVYLQKTRGESIVNTPRPYILFVGARGNYKNFDFVLKVLAKTSYDLVAAGSKFTEEEEQIIAQYSGRVTLLSNVSDEKLKALYQHAHAFIYPSLYEGFGIPVLEAMNCGCPVIAFNNSSIPEIMGDSPLLLKNDDLKGTLEILSKLETASYRESILSIQYQQADKFSWGKAYEEMKAFYIKMYKN
jgi:glycosyltransferase involved in cell wall biosynthesis